MPGDGGGSACPHKIKSKKWQVGCSPGWPYQRPQGSTPGEPKPQKRAVPSSSSQRGSCRLLGSAQHSTAFPQLGCRALCPGCFHRGMWCPGQSSAGTARPTLLSLPEHRGSGLANSLVRAGSLPRALGGLSVLDLSIVSQAQD